MLRAPRAPLGPGERAHRCEGATGSRARAAPPPRNPQWPTAARRGALRLSWMTLRLAHEPLPRSRAGLGLPEVGVLGYRRKPDAGSRPGAPLVPVTVGAALACAWLVWRGRAARRSR